MTNPEYVTVCSKIHLLDLQANKWGEDGEGAKKAKQNLMVDLVTGYTFGDLIHPVLGWQQRRLLNLNLGWPQYQPGLDEKSKDNTCISPCTLGVLVRGNRAAKSKDRTCRNCMSIEVSK